MRFTGRDLLLVYRGLLTAAAEIENEIVICPDPERYAKELAELKGYKTELERLIKRVERATEKENQHG